MFDRDGYCIIECFSPDSLIPVEWAIQRLIGAQARRAKCEPTIEALEAVDHAHVAAVYDTIYQTPEFMRFISDKALTIAARTLLRADTLYCYTNRVRIDPPRDDRRTYGWHQEVFYTIPRSRFIQTWAPLVYDTSVANGTIEVAVGSHKEGIAKQEWIEPGPGRATQIIVDPAVIAKYECKPIPMKRGEVLFFDGRLAHRSGHNTSERVRYSMVGMYHDAEAVDFQPPRLSFDYRGETPREYYEAIRNPS